MRVRTSFLTLLLAAAAIHVPALAAAQQTDSTASAIAAAQRAASAWLALLDNGNFAGSWDSASSAFRAAVTQDNWESAVLRARSPFEPLGERKLLGSRYTTQLPNAPPGQYVVLQYETVAGGNQRVIETIVPNLDLGGVWRVGGYFIRPQ